LDDDVENEILTIVTGCAGVIKPHASLRTRKIGYNIAIDIHVYVKNDLTICESP
jgi:divalent metal cation (Fe/Co/Zn/Cd) transporter